MGRRRKGAGTIRQKGDSYYLRFTIQTEDGRSERKLVTLNGVTRKQAEAELARLVADVEQNGYTEPAKQPLAKWMDHWLDTHESDLSPTTAYLYRIYTEKYIKPGLGTIRLDQLRPAAIQEFYNRLKRRRSPDGSLLSAKTIRNIHGILRTALQRAYKLQEIPQNPADFAEPPKAVKPEVPVASVEEIKKPLTALRDTVWYTPVLIVAGTGLRRGEVLALKWSDYDSKTGILTVRRSLAQVGGKIIPKTTKTERSRTVKAPNFVVEYLAGLRENHEAREKLVSDYNSEGWICCDENGFVLTPNALTRALTEVTTTLGIKTRLHGLRHAQATFLITSGIAGKIASERLGHSTISITQDIYSHVFPHDQEEAAEVIDRKLRECLPEPRSAE